MMPLCGNIALLLVLFAMVSNPVLGHGKEIPCNDTETRIFQCNNGNCISREDFCNGTAICSDGSDEIQYDNATETDGIRCQFRRNDLVDKECVLPSMYLCDHELDCVGGMDECNCKHTFQCDNGECALKVSFCDNLPLEKGCSDGTDEKEYNRTTKIGFQCPVTRTHITKVCVLPDRYVCDGHSDCDFGIDECFCDFSAGQEKGIPQNDVYSNEKCFRCLDGSLVIPNIHLCDGIVHCEDLSDECLCPETEEKMRPEICASICRGPDCECPGQIQCAPKSWNSDLATSDENLLLDDNFTAIAPPTQTICLDSTSICDDTFDCENHLDENFCPLDNQTFECYDKSRKIKFYEVCNGPQDCDDGSDELFCDEITNHYCSDYRRFFPRVKDWKNVTKGAVRIPSTVVLSFDRPLYTQACDGIPFCTFFDDECDNDCPTEPGYCKYVTRGFRCPNSGSLIIGMEICDGMPTCNDTAPEDSYDEFDCPGRFYCSDRGKQRLPIHIPMEGRCNGKQECDDQSDEMGCDETTHFYCRDGGSTLFVPNSQKCDGRKDCKGGRDECQNCNPSPFSSDEKLISNRVLIIFLWIIGSFAVCGNTAVIIHQIVSLVKSSSNATAVATSNRILVLNLSASDLLVGIYLVSLGIKDATVSEYCLHDQAWRSGTTCSILGAIALIGTETSVFILLIMTAYRLYLVVRPFKSQRMLVIGIAIFAAWAISFALAFIPLSESAKDYFVSCVWFRTHHFIGRICKKDLKSFTEDLVTLEGSNKAFSGSVHSGYTWDNMFEAMKHLNSSYEPERFFGYYSAHSVCLPRLFPDPNNDKAWGYSLFLILLNFFAFVFILVSYIHIYRTTTGRNIQKAKAEDRAAALQRKVTRIVLTDFCCWMPICIMAFIRVSGIVVPDLVYAITAIILLPINSAMNPFLYSDILDIVWQKLAPLRRWAVATTCGRKFEQMQKRKSMSKRDRAEPVAPSCNSEDTRSTMHTGLNMASNDNTVNPLTRKIEKNGRLYSVGGSEVNGAYESDEKVCTKI